MLLAADLSSRVKITVTITIAASQSKSMSTFYLKRKKNPTDAISNKFKENIIILNLPKYISADIFPIIFTFSLIQKCVIQEKQTDKQKTQLLSAMSF